jgi:hypothetical protein
MLARALAIIMALAKKRYLSFVMCPSFSKLAFMEKFPSSVSTSCGGIRRRETA